MKSIIAIALCMFTLISCNQAQKTTETTLSGNISKTAEGPFYSLQGEPLEAVKKSEEDWKKELDGNAYYVLREEGTERAGTGELLNNKEEGVYTCGACSLPLFTSDTKFKSGTGWPSFFAPINDTHIGEIKDDKYGWNRVEVECNRCGSHLGHVFEDGPKPTGLRYCINSVSLGFEAIKLEEVKIKE